MFSKSDLEPTMQSLTILLPVLPNLHTIQILHCRSPGPFTSAIRGLHLPTVRTLIIPTECGSLLKACPNVTHVRCLGGNGSTVVTSLKYCRAVEKLDGMIDWNYKSTMRSE